MFDICLRGTANTGALRQCIEMNALSRVPSLSCSSVKSLDSFNVQTWVCYSSPGKKSNIPSLYGLYRWICREVNTLVFF